MSNIKQLRANDSNIYPVTHEDAVMDDSGVAISAKYATKENVNAQIAELNNSLSSVQSTITSANNAIGDLSQLQTSNKSSIVAAVNEAFQYGNSVKQSLVDALIAKEVNVSTSSSISQLIAKIADIEQGGEAPDFSVEGVPPWYTTAQIATENFWATGATITATRQGAGGGAIGNNIYVCGGLNGTTSSYQKTTYCYNTKTNQWSTKANMAVAKYEHATAVANNMLYAIGGNSASGTRTATVYCYDPSTNTWSEKQSMPVSYNAFPAATANNKIYTFGGYTTAAVKNSYCYDVAGNTWSEIQPLPTASYASAATYYSGDQIYVMGGIGLNKNYCYDTKTNIYTERQVIPASVGNHSISTIRDQIYLVGGGTGSGGTSPTNVVRCYNPSTNQWSTKTSLPASMYNHTGIKARNNIYVIGGRSGNSILNTTYCYVPESNK